MKKVIIFSLFALFFFAAHSQNNNHRFGVGINTDILFDRTNLNPFGSFSLDPPIVVPMNCQNVSYFRYGIYFEYEYILNKSFSFSARAKYAERNTDYLFHYSDFDGTKTMIGMQRLSNTIRSLEIPVLANYHLPISSKTNWLLNLGGGVGFVIPSQLREINGELGSVPLMDKRYNFKLGYHNSVNGFLQIGTGFEFLLNGRNKMQATISYTFYPVENYFFENSVIDNSNNTTIMKVNRKFRPNDLEIGFAVFF